MDALAKQSYFTVLLGAAAAETGNRVPVSRAPIAPAH